MSSQPGLLHRARRRLRTLAAPATQSADTRTTFLAAAELVRRHHEDTPHLAGGLGLSPYELRVFSQSGEDGVIAEIVRRIGAPGRFFVEFGIQTGIEGNSVALAELLGWRGVFLEADDACFAALSEKYRGIPTVQTVQAIVTSQNIEALFADAGVPDEPDLLSIDVDGDDLWIWSALEQYRPRLVIVEYNSALGPDRRLVQPRATQATAYDGTDAFGASVAALEAVGCRKGYRLVHTDLCGVNAFFVREDLAGPFPAADAVPRRAPNFGLVGGRAGRGDHSAFLDVPVDGTPPA